MYPLSHSIIIQYPATGVGHKFAQGLIHMFYSTSWFGTFKGIFMLIKYSIVGGPPKPAAPAAAGDLITDPPSYYYPFVLLTYPLLIINRWQMTLFLILTNY